MAALEVWFCLFFMATCGALELKVQPIGNPQSSARIGIISFMWDGPGCGYEDGKGRRRSPKEVRRSSAWKVLTSRGILQAFWGRETTLSPRGSHRAPDPSVGDVSSSAGVLATCRALSM